MKNLLKNWRIVFLLCAVVFSFLAISFNGLDLGVDFSGGTLFQIHLAEKVSNPEDMATVTRTIQQRLDWTGLKDTKVSAWGEEFVIAQIAETNPEKVEKLESLLLKQGKFEVVFDGNLVFTGEDILSIPKDPSLGYGFRKIENAVQWILPFVLNDSGLDSAAKRFARMTFHRCAISYYDPASGGRQYDCEKTYFFIDRPTESVLVIPRAVHDSDTQLLLAGNLTENIPQGTSIEELLHNANLPYVVVGEEGFTEEQETELSNYIKANSTAIVFPLMPQNLKQELVDIGFRLSEQEPFSTEYHVNYVEEGFQNLVPGTTIPWTWQVAGAKQVISLSEDIANLEPYVENVEDAQIFNQLIIRGSDLTEQQAQDSLRNLTVLLESGSLPVGVDNISKETISPLLGKEFLQSVFWIGVIALFTVSLVLFLRYRRLKLMIPIMFTGLSEVYLVLGFAALINWRLDLASVAGILAAVGTGVDDQIIITDELMKGEQSAKTSLLNKIKTAFFMIMAAAATTIATMFPVIMMGLGFGKLVGFAITTIIGVLIGVFITRPAYAEVAKYILEHDSRNK